MRLCRALLALSLAMRGELSARRSAAAVDPCEQRANGVSVTALAKQHDVHRSTIWVRVCESP